MDIPGLPGLPPLWPETPAGAGGGPQPSPAMRLFCLPHAGGSAAAYAGWGRALGPRFRVVAVELPGRGRRIRQAPYASATALVDRLLAELAADMRDGPFAIFGHSMGGLLAFQLTHEIVRHGLPCPSRLFISAALPPQRARRGTLHMLSDAELVAALGRLNGASAQALAHPELIHLMLPVVRADLQLAETWSFRPTAALDIPVSLIGGQRDPLVPPDEMDGWREHFVGEVMSRTYPGDHFYLQDHVAVFSDINNDILASIGRTGLGQA